MISLFLYAAVGFASQSGPIVTAPIATSPILTSPAVPAPVVLRTGPRVVVALVPPAVRARSTASLPALFSTDDYPQAALRGEQQGTVAVALAVGREGRVTACDVTTSSGSAALDLTTCSILQRRARFTPARDASGKVVEDTTRVRIRWVLPSRAPEVLADGYRRMVVSLDGAGKATKCRGEMSVKGPPPPPALCEFAKAAAARVMAAADPDVDFHNRELAIEGGIRVGSSESLLRLGRGTGERLVALSAFDLDIDASGAVIRCTSADGFLEVRDSGAICANKAKRRFNPGTTGEVRHATVYNALYTRDAR